MSGEWQWNQKDQRRVVVVLQSVRVGQCEEELAGAVGKDVEEPNVSVSRERGAETLPSRRLVVDPDGADSGRAEADEDRFIGGADGDAVSHDEKTRTEHECKDHGHREE